MLRHSRGPYTQAQVDRAGKLVGMTGKNLDRIMAKQVATTYVRSGISQTSYKCRDVGKFVEVTENYTLNGM